MSKRKPYNNDAGYVCSLKCPDGGHVVIYDREKGGDWIDGDERWVVSKYNSEGSNQGLLEFSSQQRARELMKDTAKHGCDEWYETA